VNSGGSSQSPQRKAPSAYTGAGVNIPLADALKAGLKSKIRKAGRPEVLGAIGGFGGLFAFDKRKYKRPVFVSSMDGVGTKLKIAVMMNRHDTVGQDLVNHCVNDIAVLGAEPLFFLDYVGMGKLIRRVFDQIIEGLARACAAAGCALIGGETAQMPGLYAARDYDLVGTVVGVVERDRIIDGSKIRPGDAVIGLGSTGLHTNGYSLARQILFTKMRVRLEEYHSALGCTFGEELLKVHRNYWPVIQKLLNGDRRLVTGSKKSPSQVTSLQSPIHGIAHITGGGFRDNIPRVLPKNCGAAIHRGSWKVLPIFKLLQEGGGITEAEMYRIFNMGIGMVLIVEAQSAAAVQEIATKTGIPAYLIGEIRKGKPVVAID